MPRFFVEGKEISQNIIRIIGDDVKHIKNVLRLQVNDMIVVCDGNGNDYEVMIDEVRGEFINTKIINSYRNKAESTVSITLYQVIPKSDKMDFIIQKSVELGVSKIVTVCSERSVVKINTEKDKSKKLKRWNKISQEAAKQSGRGIIPLITGPIGYDEAVLQMKEDERHFILYEKEESLNLKSYLTQQESRDKKNISFMVGSEGGFSESEIEKANNLGIESIGLGKRILRTETVALTVLSIIMYEIGDV